MSRRAVIGTAFQLAAVTILAAWAGFAHAQGGPTILHSFDGVHQFGQGANPFSGVTRGTDGTLYGVTAEGGEFACEFGEGCGTVFALHPDNTGAPTVFELIHVFSQSHDGFDPAAPLTIDKHGDLWGTTFDGGDLNCGVGGFGCGVIFEEIAPKHGGAWQHKIVHAFSGSPKDGAYPQGELTLDRHSGVLYGTTCFGGALSLGSVYSLTPNGDKFDFAVIHSFKGSDGICPGGHLALDGDGNLFGIAADGGAAGNGTVFELIPGNKGWKLMLIHVFRGGHNDGALPVGGIVIDGDGNLFGATDFGGIGSLGTVFEISRSGHRWHETLLHQFQLSDGSEPAQAKLAIDASGNLFGTTTAGGGNFGGTAFELAKTGASYFFSTVYNFCGQPSCADGLTPDGGIVLDADGNMYGTTFNGGPDDSGEVFELPAF